MAADAGVLQPASGGYAALSIVASPRRSSTRVSVGSVTFEAMHVALAAALASGCASPSPPPETPGEAPAPAPAPIATTRALAWTVDLAPGHVVTAADVAIADLPDLAPDPMRAPTSAIGATVREPVYAGEPVRAERLVRRDGVSGFAALVPDGRALAIVDVPVHALAGIDPGCAIEVIDAVSGRRAPATTLSAELGDDGSARLVVAADPGAALPEPGTSAHDRFTAVSLALDPPEDARGNDGPITFAVPDRPGPLVAVALRTLAPGVMVRSDDLGEVGGVGVEGALRLPEAWARYPIHAIYAGELPNPRRFAGDGRGACTAIPAGMRAVALPTAETPSDDWVGGLVRVRAASRGSTMDDLYVGAVYRVMSVALVYADPKRARALAIAGAGGAPFEVTPSRP